MSIVRVAVPVLKGKRRFFIAKGRPWSLVEHVFLASLVVKPRTVDELASAANVPRRLVLEVLIRLMRAGWVALSQEPNGVVFSASESGKAVAGDEELPQVSKTMSRWMNFVIDKLTGTIYRSREMPFQEKHIVEQRALRERVVWLDPREIQTFDDTGGVLAALFDDDEKFIAVEPSGDRMVDRYAVITVRNGVVEGLPQRAPAELESLILKAAKDAPPTPLGEHSPTVKPEPMPLPSERIAPIPLEAIFQISDLILGGVDHQKALHDAITRARKRIIVHSTFISEERFVDVSRHLYEAAKRGAIIDVLWGEDEEKTESVTTAKTIVRLRKQIEEDGLSTSIRIHAFSTRSHSKLLIFDDGRTERLSAIVGSCNWLSTRFQNYEVSVRLRDPRVVAAVLEQVSDLTRGHDGHWTELTSEIARLAVETRRQRLPSVGSKAQVRIVLGPQHAQFVRMARDQAEKRVFVTSHRLGAATRAGFIVPAIAAVREKSIEVRAYYGMQGGTVTAATSARLAIAGIKDGVQIRPEYEPNLHAKILAWDDDNVLITSQNWLSADPSESNMRREIGIFIRFRGTAKHLIENFENSRHK